MNPSRRAGVDRFCTSRSGAGTARGRQTFRRSRSIKAPLRLPWSQLFHPFPDAPRHVRRGAGLRCLSRAVYPCTARPDRLGMSLLPLWGGAVPHALPASDPRESVLDHRRRTSYSEHPPVTAMGRRPAGTPAAPVAMGEKVTGAAWDPNENATSGATWRRRRLQKVSGDSALHRLRRPNPRRRCTVVTSSRTRHCRRRSPSHPREAGDSRSRC